MQVTVRSYLTAGIAAAGVTALAIAPLPSMTQDIQVPAVEIPVALTAQPSLSDLIALGIADGAALAGGAFGSGTSANTFLGFDSQVLGTALGAIVTQVGNNPAALPTVIAAAPLLAIQLTNTVEHQFTGVTASGSTGSGSNTKYTLPGQADPADGIITSTFPFVAVVPTVVTPFNAAAVKVANDFDNVSASLGGPKVIKPLTSGAQAVGTSIVQAQGLVRNATVGAVTGVAAAALSGNPQAVGNAVQGGADGIAKSVFGDPSVPLVNPATGKVSTNTALNTAAPVKKLGAIGTVSSTVQKAANDIGNAVNPN